MKIWPSEEVQRGFCLCRVRGGAAGLGKVERVVHMGQKLLGVGKVGVTGCGCWAALPLGLRWVKNCYYSSARREMWKLLAKHLSLVQMGLTCCLWYQLVQVVRPSELNIGVHPSGESHKGSNSVFSSFELALLKRQGITSILGIEGVFLWLPSRVFITAEQLQHTSEKAACVILPLPLCA